jgi:hypothetical protein
MSESNSYAWLFYLLGSAALIAVGAFGYRACAPVMVTEVVRQDTLTLRGDTVLLPVERWRVVRVTETEQKTDTLIEYYLVDPDEPGSVACADTVLRRTALLKTQAGEQLVPFTDQIGVEYNSGLFRLEFLDAPLIYADTLSCHGFLDNSSWLWYVVAILGGAVAAFIFTSFTGG